MSVKLSGTPITQTQNSNDEDLQKIYDRIEASAGEVEIKAQSNLTAHTTDTNNPHSVTKALIGLGNVDNTSDANKPVSTAMLAALNGKAQTNHASTGTSYGAGSGTNYGHVKVTEGNGLSISNGVISMAASSAVPTFVYKCTGTADSIAIATIVNNFFNNGTAMSMKLIITGTMGVAFTSTYYAIFIDAVNTRGAVCYLDFSDCHISNITSKDRDFLVVSGSTTELVITGLVVTATRYDVSLSGGNNTFCDCSITSTGLYGGISCMGVNLSGGNNTFNNCSITGYNAGVNISAGNNSFNNCKITLNTAYSGKSVFSSGGHNTFNNCIISCPTEYGAHLNGTGYIIFSNCLVTSAATYSYGLTLGNTFAGIVTLVSCKIIGGSTGVRVETANTAAEIKLIGCAIKGTTTQDIHQTTAASTIKWYIMGNSFSRVGINVNGTSAITNAVNESIYFPQYANQFSRMIN